MLIRKGFATVSVLVLILVFSASPTIGDDNISDPSKVSRLLSDFIDPSIKPGSSGTYGFTLKNPYDGNITNIIVTITIYKYATLETARNVDATGFNSPPRILNSVHGNSQEYKFPITGILVLAPNETQSIRITILTDEDTPQGTYYVKHKLEFTFDLESYVMMSIGYFSDEAWRHATDTGVDKPWGLNLSALGVDGVIPDSSFDVTKPRPLWPFYSLIVLTIFFGILSIVFYMQEHPDKYPKLNKSLQYWTGKFNQFKLMLKYSLRNLRRKV